MVPMLFNDGETMVLPLPRAETRHNVKTGILQAVATISIHHRPLVAMQALPAALARSEGAWHFTKGRKSAGNAIESIVGLLPRILVSRHIMRFPFVILGAV